MSLRITVKDRQGTDSHQSFNHYPDKCPRCHRSIDIKHERAALVKGPRLQFLCRCSASECDEFFVATYRQDFRSGEFHLSSCAPMNPLQQQFPATVSEVSPTFVEIFGQAMVAESQGLEQLVGIGLRKALEFLVKDFASNQHPDQLEQIQKIMLGPCIDKYVTDSNLKETAKRAVWLGNDETHYVRKWDDKDIRDLKLLVRLTSNWVDNVLLTQKYVAEMPPHS